MDDGELRNHVLSITNRMDIIISQNQEILNFYGTLKKGEQGNEKEVKKDENQDKAETVEGIQEAPKSKKMRIKRVRE